MRLLDARGRERHVFVPGETVTLAALRARARGPWPTSSSGSGSSPPTGTRVYGTNTDLEGFTGSRLAGDGEVRLALEGLSLVEGTYLVDVAAHRRDGTPYDYLRGLHSFRVKSRVKDVGVYRPAPPLGLHGRPLARPPRAARRARPRRRARRLSAARGAMLEG